MRRTLALAGLIIVCFLLQTTVFKFLELGGIGPNVLLILTMSFGLMRGRKEGLLVGFFSGLLVDIFFGFAIGPYAMIYMVLGYCNGFFHKLYYVEDVLLPIIMIAINEIAYNLIVFSVFFMMRNRLDIMFYFKNVVFPELVYTILITLILYKLFNKINKVLKKKEEGGIE